MNMLLSSQVVFQNESNLDQSFGIVLKNLKMDEKLFPRFVVIASILLKSLKHFQVQKSKRMLEIFIQILEGCQKQPQEQKSNYLFQMFKENLKSLQDNYIHHEYILQQLQNEMFVFTLGLVANVIYHNHEAQPNQLYGETLLPFFQEFNLDIFFSYEEVQPNFSAIVIQQLDQDSFGVIV